MNPLKKPQHGRSRPESIAAKQAIGAFCTDIAKSTERIQQFQKLALSHHKLYLEEAGRFFIKNGPKGTPADDGFDDLWAPGDALWGVLFASPGVSADRSIIRLLWRTIASFAHGLSEANSKKPEELPDLQIRGVFLAGPVIRETLFENRMRLYNGTALNACGRIEAQVKEREKPNTIVAGFVVSKEDADDALPVQMIARSPIVSPNGADGFDSYLGGCTKPGRYGYRIKLETVMKDNHRVLRFRAWPGRGELRGLENCRILTTRIELELTPDCGFELAYVESGAWERSKVDLNLTRGGVSQFDLHDLLERRSTSFDFLAKVYERGELRFTLASGEDPSLILQSTAKTHRPRVKGERVDRVALGEDSFCVLPTEGIPESYGANVLLQSYGNTDARMLCLSLVDRRLLTPNDDGADYIDSASPAFEFSLG